ncbi:Rha family transcriptional regulator [Pseudomonas sp. PDM21]|uniref:phage regulatory CII family protein n=1 Tax=Pseudomonas sp. PDM21 TaxID=2769257 RepID=UPI0017814156|nr:phage regulatory CII family protein [Pseudomonas sp. PDM21]MBD9671599.1 Rha family transcriptional regulator [Pseudomonas sp. PDM21]
MENIQQSIHETVLEACAKQLAPKMGLSHVSLLQRSNPQNEGHQLTFAQFYQINLHSQDHRSLRALANDFGYDLVGGYVVTEKTPIQALMDSLKQSASTTQIVMEALEDRILTAQERKDIENAIAAEQKAQQQLLAAVRNMPIGRAV